MNALSRLPSEAVLLDLADLFKLFSDSTRIKILYALMDKSLCVAEIAETCNLSPSATSHQLQKLKQARLIKSQREGKNIIYSLCDSHVLTVLEQGLEHIKE